MDDLNAHAGTDPAAAVAIEAAKAAVSAKNRRYREKLKEQAKTDPAAAQKIIDRKTRSVVIDWSPSALEHPHWHALVIGGTPLRRSCPASPAVSAAGTDSVVASC